MKKVIVFSSMTASLLLINSTQAIAGGDYTAVDNQAVGYNLATGLPADKTKRSAVTTQKAQTLPVSSLSPLETEPVIIDKNAPTLTEKSDYPFLTGYTNNLGDGLAIGAQLGIATGLAKTSFTSVDEQTRGLGLGSVGGLHVDYGYSFAQSWYIGAEIYGNFENLSATNTFQDTYANYKIESNYGFVLLPGYHLSPNNVLYAKLGVNRANLNFQGTDSGTSSWELGSDLGLGFRQALNEYISLAIEYDWMNYNNSLSATSALGVAGTSTASFNQSIYQASLNYQFGAIDSKVTQTALNLTGFYVGASAGTRGQIMENEYYFNSAPGDKGESYFHSNGWAERLKLGYGYQFNNNYYLGAEIFGGYAQALKPEQFNRSFNTETYSFGASLLPGYIVNQGNLLFARLGYIATHFSNYNGAVAFGSASSYNKLANGGELGLGYETALMNNLSLVLECDYDQYASFTTAATSEGQVNKYKFSDTMATLGLNYRF